LFRRAESNHTTSRLAFPGTREKGSAFRGRCAIFSRLVLLPLRRFPFIQKTRALAFCDVASRSYRAPPLPRVRT
jgi:hypothetical protein